MKDSVFIGGFSTIATVNMNQHTYANKTDIIRTGLLFLQTQIPESAVIIANRLINIEFWENMIKQMLNLKVKSNIKIIFNSKISIVITALCPNRSNLRNCVAVF